MGHSFGSDGWSFPPRLRLRAARTTRRDTEGRTVLHDPFTPPIPPAVLETWVRRGVLHGLAATRGWPFVQALIESGLLGWLATQAGTVSDQALTAELQARLPEDVWRRAIDHLAQRDADGPWHRCAD